MSQMILTLDAKNSKLVATGSAPGSSAYTAFEVACCGSAPNQSQPHSKQAFERISSQLSATAERRYGNGRIV